MIGSQHLSLYNKSFEQHGLTLADGVFCLSFFGQGF